MKEKIFSAKGSLVSLLIGKLGKLFHVHILLPSTFLQLFLVYCLPLERTQNEMLCLILAWCLSVPWFARVLCTAKCTAHIAKVGSAILKKKKKSAYTLIQISSLMINVSFLVYCLYLHQLCNFLGTHIKILPCTTTQNKLTRNMNKTSVLLIQLNTVTQKHKFQGQIKNKASRPPSTFSLDGNRDVLNKI